MIDLKHLSDNQFRAVLELALTTGEADSFAEGRIAAAIYELTGCSRSVDREEIQKAIYYEKDFRNFNDKGFVFIKAFGDWDYLGGFIDDKEKFMKIMEKIYESIMKRQREALTKGDFTKGGLVPAGTYATDGNQPSGDPEYIGPLDMLKGMLGEM